ncbi:C39 family peptidase [Geitlerinema calcuttense]|uniref:Peptidase C39-like domain-containing protein n=1 Tax=Geitlerinema calcuttense NRMC-F 0142 TaxID=2922238 RepID=A0ABT7LVA2_9CYAN|nr:C39 family peptidase [Geitlerinema calcuttense]MDL5055962.1 hypothetical protein [Geitlerinema calcuttense NRMC-F 0142]
MVYNKDLKKYSVLYKKYPELGWIEKYALSEQGHIVTELTGLLGCLKGLDFFWTYEANIDLYTTFITAGIPVISIIRLQNESKHTVVIVGFDQSECLLFVHDPLGNYHTDYSDYNGAKIPFTYELFQNIGIGNPLSLFCIATPQSRSQCIHFLQKIKHFYFTTEEVIESLQLPLS